MIKILVEGDGEVRSLPVLFAKAGKGLEFDCIDMQGKTNFVRQQDGFERTIQRQYALGFQRFCLLLDADRYFFPYASFYEESAGMEKRAEVLRKSLQVDVALFWARRAYESWIIGGMDKSNAFCGLTKVKVVSGDTQSHPLEPKQWIKSRLPDGRYDATKQHSLTKCIDLGLAMQRNRSLQDFLSYF